MNLNRSELIGHVGSKPELKHTDGGVPVCEISVATNRHWKDKQSGEQKESTEWHRVVLWRAQAEWAAKNLPKGALVFVEGELRTQEYEKNGARHWSTKIHAHMLIWLNRPPRGDRGPLPTDADEPPPRTDDDIPF